MFGFDYDGGGRSMMNVMKKLLIFILAILALICTAAIWSKSSKSRLIKNVDEQREAACRMYEEAVPKYVSKRYSWIKDVSCTVEAVEKPCTYMGDKSGEIQYYEWHDCIRLTFTADESFDRLTNGKKLQCFKDLWNLSKEKAERILSETADLSLYNEYFNETEIFGLRDHGIFPKRDVIIYINTDKNFYDYMHNDAVSSEVFRMNYLDIDITMASYYNHVSTGSGSKSSNSSSGNSLSTNSSSRYNSGSGSKSSGSKSSGSKSSGKKSSGKKSSHKSYSYEQDMPDCDDYESWGEFMDDWDGNMPDGSDASDYWDNW